MYRRESSSLCATAFREAGLRPTGTVILYDGPSTLGTASLNASGQAVFAPVTLSAGTHSIFASYGGDSNFLPSASAPVPQTILAAPTVSFTGAPASAVCQSTFTVSATSSDGATPVITASAACSILGSVVTMSSGTGACSLTAAWPALNNFAAATASQSTIALKAGSTIAITSDSPNPSAPGQSVNVGFTVSGITSPTGTVTVTATTGESCSVVLTAGSGSCSLVSTLVSGGSCLITVTFVGGTDNYSPTSFLTVADSATASPQSVPLSGTVINPQATLSSYVLNFGRQKARTTSAPKSIILTNTGTTTLTLSKLSVTGSFALAPGTTCLSGTTVTAGATCVINLTFTPTSTGVQAGDVTINDNALLSPQIAALLGTGN